MYIRSGPGNPGRCYDENVDLTNALSKHYDPELAKSKIIEVHDWLTKDANISEQQKESLGWKQAYSLTTWEPFAQHNPTATSAILSRLGLKTYGAGDSKETKQEANVMRGIVRRKSSLC